MTLIKPNPKDKRHPVDYRDEIEHEEVAKVLSELPVDHAACVAYYSGAKEAADSLSMSHLLTDRMDLVKRLVAAYYGHSSRIWEKTGRRSDPRTAQ